MVAAVGPPSLAVGLSQYTFLALQSGNVVLGPAWTLCLEASFYVTLPRFSAAARTCVTAVEASVAAQILILAGLVGVGVAYQALMRLWEEPRSSCPATSTSSP